MSYIHKKTKKYQGGRTIEVHEMMNPDTAMKRLQRWLKEENFFMELREREEHVTNSQKKRKSHHLAKTRECKRWDKMEKEFGPVKPKRVRTKSNRGKKTCRRDVKKPNGD